MELGKAVLISAMLALAAVVVLPIVVGRSSRVVRGVELIRESFWLLVGAGLGLGVVAFWLGWEWLGIGLAAVADVVAVTLAWWFGRLVESPASPDPGTLRSE